MTFLYDKMLFNLSAFGKFKTDSIKKKLLHSIRNSMHQMTSFNISHCIDSAGMLAETVCALWLKWQNFNWKFLHQERTTEPHVGRMTRVTQLYEHHSLLNWCDFCQILLYIISVFDVEVDEKLCMIYFCVPSFLSYSIDAFECMWIKFDLVALL